MTPRDAERSASIVGLVTLAIGAFLTATPARAASALNLGDHPTFARAIEIADLALVPGLLRGRPRWPWMAARASMNLLLAVHYSAEFHERAERRTRDGAISMAILVVVDASIARRLRTANR